MSKPRYNVWFDKVPYEGEKGSPETQTETAGYMTTTQQLARLAKAGYINKMVKGIGVHDVVTAADEELFISGAFDEPAYDLASVEEGMAQLRARAEATSAGQAAAEAEESEPEAPVEEPPAEEPPVEGG